MTRVLLIAVLLSAAVLAIGSSIGAQQPASDGPSYTSSGELVRPPDYREWVYVTTGLGMTYGPAAEPAGRAPRFDNVFVNRASYRAFVSSGKWPDKTVFVLEVRGAASHGSINRDGHFQTDLVAIEAEVKDEARFPGKWAYFNFVGDGGALKDSTGPLPASAPCYACHSTNAAVENTFVQFYPTLLDVARTFGTLKPSYHP